MRKIFLAMVVFLGLFSFAQAQNLNKPSSNTPPVNLNFQGGQFLGCEIHFMKSDLYDDIFMHISNIVYYRRDNQKIKFEFNRLKNNGGIAVIEIPVAEQNNFINEFLRRRNVCSFSPIQ